MHSNKASGSPSAKAFVAIAAILSTVLLVELFLRALPLYDYSDPQDFFLNRQGNLLRKGTAHYETVLFGDSRSMALSAPTGDSSFYNFSVPGMGNRHYALSLQRFFDSGRRPQTVVLASLPHILLAGRERPIPALDYAEGESVPEALAHMIQQRLQRPFIQATHQTTTHLVAKQSEAAFLRARLHYLGYVDSVRLYSGMDAIVQAYEGAPALYRTYFMRSAIQQIPAPSGPSASCKTCEEIYSGICADQSAKQRTQRVESVREAEQGTFNLDNLATPSGRIALRVTRDFAIGDLAKIYDNTDVQPDTTALESMVRVAADHRVRFVFLELPLPERPSKGRNVAIFRQAIKDVLSRYPNTAYYQFPELEYSEDLFIDPLHLSCYGAIKLNQDWNRVFPAIKSQTKSSVQ